MSVRKLWIVAIAAITMALAAPAAVQENHCHEMGTGALFTRSAFVHGYRHGYEAGYHEGNIDINMARHARTTSKQFKGISTGYEQTFGSRKSFDRGFGLGLKAGYSDGYAGKNFRAVESLRMAAASLEETPSQSDPGNLFFDRGVTLGYQDGFAQGRSAEKDSAMMGVDLKSVHCSFHPTRKNEAGAESSYCDGYRRGFLLGHGDGLALGRGQGLLEASK